MPGPKDKQNIVIFNDSVNGSISTVERDHFQEACKDRKVKTSCSAKSYCDRVLHRDTASCTLLCSCIQIDFEVACKDKEVKTSCSPISYCFRVLHEDSASCALLCTCSHTTWFKWTISIVVIGAFIAIVGCCCWCCNKRSRSTLHMIWNKQKCNKKSRSRSWPYW